MDTLKRKAPDGPEAADQASPLKAPRVVAPTSEPPAPTALATAEPVACVHDVSYPEGYDASASTSRAIAGGADASEPARKFPFQLDPFQSEAIRCVDNGESVMVPYQLHFFFFRRVSFDHLARCMCHICIFFSSIQMTPLDWIR